MKLGFVLTPYSPRELHVPGHDGDSLGMNGAEEGILEETDDVRLSSLDVVSSSKQAKPGLV